MPHVRSHCWCCPLVSAVSTIPPPCHLVPDSGTNSTWLPPWSNMATNCLHSKSKLDHLVHHLLLNMLIILRYNTHFYMSHTYMHTHRYMQLYQFNWVYSEHYVSAMADQFCAAPQLTSTAYTTKCGHIQLCQPPQLDQYNQANMWGHYLRPR